MFAGDSPKLDDAPVPLVPAATPTRKRKHAAVTHADSPDPTTTDVHAVLPSRHDLSSRPRLSISRFPLFIPTSDGSPYHSTEQLAMNRIGFRYVPAGVSDPGSALPCRTIQSNPTHFRVSWEDRSPFVKVTQDGLGLLGDKGYRSARCNAPIREGRWYMEVKIEHGGGDRAPESSKREGSHVRLGWGRREAALNAPVGLDGYSYGLCDKTGDKVTLSRPKPYARPFKSGDVIGMYISLPPRPSADPRDPHDPTHIHRERIAIEFKGQEYFESLECTQSKEMLALMDNKKSVSLGVGANINTKDLSSPLASSASHPSPTKKSATVKNLPERSGPGSKKPLNGSSTHAQAQPAVKPLRPLPTLPGSLIAFFINGESQGIAFSDIYSYFPLRAPSSKEKEKEKKKSKEGTREHKENPFDDGTLGYYPFISLFNDARVRIQPGPDFSFPPPNDIDALLASSSGDENDHGIDIDSKERTWRPIFDRYPEYMREQWDLDDMEEAAAQHDLRKRVAQEEMEAEKQKVKEKRKMQSDARKKAKKEAAVGKGDAKGKGGKKQLKEEREREERERSEMEQLLREERERERASSVATATTPVSTVDIDMDMDEDRFGPNAIVALPSDLPSPSPSLGPSSSRHDYLYMDDPDPDGYVPNAEYEREHEFDSSVDLNSHTPSGVYSGYNSYNGYDYSNYHGNVDADIDAEGEVEVEEEESVSLRGGREEEEEEEEGSVVYSTSYQESPRTYWVDRDRDQVDGTYDYDPS